MGKAFRLAAVGVLAAVWGCFSAPSADVLFACDPQTAPQCPPDYTCQSDGCCHRDGTDVEASMGACKSAADSGLNPTETATETATDAGTDTDPGTSSGASTESSSGDVSSSSDTSAGTDSSTGTQTGSGSSSSSSGDNATSSTGA